MTVKMIQRPSGRSRNKHPVFIATTTFYDGLPPDFGQDGSPFSAAGLRVSEEEYWNTYYGVSDYVYEWNNGILEEKPVSDYATFKVYKWLFLLVDAYLMSNPIGRLVALETGVRMSLGDGVSIRKPDFFVIRNDNPALYRDNDRRFIGVADLCVEAVSDLSRADIERDTKTKRHEYALAGVREYFLLDAKARHLAFFRRTAQGNYEPILVGDDGLVRSEVLPGLQFRVSDLFDQPSLPEMSEDEVYRQFVLPEYGTAMLEAKQARIRAEEAETRAEQERSRAEQERSRAEQERSRAEEAETRVEQERSRAERLAAKLNALGATDHDADWT
jgi:Uma2 family endonuclease